MSPELLLNNQCTNCMSFNKVQACIGNYLELRSICPCKNCVVQIMCEKLCDKYEDLMPEAMNKCAIEKDLIN